MGSIHSKSTDIHHYPIRFPTKHYHRFSSNSRPSSLLSICTNNNYVQHPNHKQRLCLKRKVLILGLDGVGKTDLFTRIISEGKQGIKLDPLPRPTIGYNVETIKMRCHHFCHRQYHKITLWDCGGDLAVRTLWSYHYSNTSLLLWVMNIHDRSRLDASLQLLSQILTNSSLYQVPVLIVLYKTAFETDEDDSKFLTNLEVAFRFLATLSNSRASTFKWQVINITFEENDSQTELKKLRQCLKELMEL